MHAHLFIIHFSEERTVKRETLKEPSKKTKYFAERMEQTVVEGTEETELEIGTMHSSIALIV